MRPNRYLQVRLLLLDPQVLVSPDVHENLELLSDIIVTGEVGNCATALELCAAQQPDVLLLLTDWSADVTLGIIQTFYRRFPALPIVVMSIRPTPLRMVTSFAAGACGYVIHDSLADLPEVLRLAARGGYACCSSSKREVAARIVTYQDLSAREAAIAAQITVGQTNAEIAHLLGIKCSTVETHIEHILRKIKGRTRVDIATWWLRRVEPPEEENEAAESGRVGEQLMERTVGES